MSDALSHARTSTSLAGLVGELEALIARVRELVTLIGDAAEHTCCIPWIFASAEIEKLLEKIEDSIRKTPRCW